MKRKMLLILLVLAIVIFACDFTSSSEDDVATQVKETDAAQASATAAIENAIKDMLTSSAPPPSDTPLPATDTPTPGLPTETPTETPTEMPTITPSPTKSSIVSYQTSSGDCKNETGNIEFRNNTGTTASVDLVLLAKGRTCTYFIFLAPVGSSWFWVEPGKYRITMTSCHGTRTLDNALNSGWWFRFKAC